MENDKKGEGIRREGLETRKRDFRRRVRFLVYGKTDGIEADQGKRRQNRKRDGDCSAWLGGTKHQKKKHSKQSKWGETYSLKGVERNRRLGAGNMRHGKEKASEEGFLDYINKGGSANTSSNATKAGSRKGLGSKREDEETGGLERGRESPLLGRNRVRTESVKKGP